MENGIPHIDDPVEIFHGQSGILLLIEREFHFPVVITVPFSVIFFRDPAFNGGGEGIDQRDDGEPFSAVAHLDNAASLEHFIEVESIGFSFGIHESCDFRSIGTDLGKDRPVDVVGHDADRAVVAGILELEQDRGIEIIIDGGNLLELGFRGIFLAPAEESSDGLESLPVGICDSEQKFVLIADFLDGSNRLFDSRLGEIKR